MKNAELVMILVWILQSSQEPENSWRVTFQTYHIKKEEAMKRKTFYNEQELS